MESCDNAIGKGAMCFVDPWVAMNDRGSMKYKGSVAKPANFSEHWLCRSGHDTGTLIASFADQLVIVAGDPEVLAP